MTIRHWAPLALIALAGAATAAEPAKKPATNAPQAAAKKPAGPVGATRDWSRIDTNKDGSISPEEMEKYLAENPGPLKK